MLTKNEHYRIRTARGTFAFAQYTGISNSGDLEFSFRGVKYIRQLEEAHMNVLVSHESRPALVVRHNNVVAIGILYITVHCGLELVKVTKIVPPYSYVEHDEYDVHETGFIENGFANQCSCEKAQRISTYYRIIATNAHGLRKLITLTDNTFMYAELGEFGEKLSSLYKKQWLAEASNQDSSIYKSLVQELIMLHRDTINLRTIKKFNEAYELEFKSITDAFTTKCIPSESPVIRKQYHPYTQVDDLGVVSLKSLARSYSTWTDEELKAVLKYRGIIK